MMIMMWGRSYVEIESEREKRKKRKNRENEDMKKRKRIGLVNIMNTTLNYPCR